MIEVFVGLLGLIILSAVIQDMYKVPSPITIISIVLALKVGGFNFFEINGQSFDALVILTFPLLIAADALKIKWNDLREHWFSLFWVAVVAILFSVGMGVLINKYVLVDVPLSLAAVALLFCTISATDPVTVSAIFGNFNIPHRLKILAEGESLLNDATALIVFSIALIALHEHANITMEFVGTKIVAVSCGAVLVGAMVGWLAYSLLKLSEDPLVEASILIFSAYAAYILAEKFHFSGILAVIVAIVLCAEKIRRLLDSKKGPSEDGGFQWLSYRVTTDDNHKLILKIFEFAAMFAAGVLFVSIAALVNFSDLLLYWKEIVAIFIASTIIRGVTMLKFALVSNKSSMMKTKVSRHWWTVLTFAGSKGAISILMVHMIPDSFEYKKLFEVIVIGNIILSTFVYAAVLSIMIPINRKKFDAEVAEEQLNGTH